MAKERYFKANNNFEVYYDYTVNYEVPPITVKVNKGDRIVAFVNLFGLLTELRIAGKTVLPACGWTGGTGIRLLKKNCVEYSDISFTCVKGEEGLKPKVDTLEEILTICPACGGELKPNQVVHLTQVIDCYYECSNPNCGKLEIMSRGQLRQHINLSHRIITS